MALQEVAITPTMQRSANPYFPNGTVHAGQYTLVFRIRHRESKEILKEHRLVLMPSVFAQSTEGRAALYYTKGGPRADTPSGSAVGITVFQIAGHTGMRGIVAASGSAVAARVHGPATPEAFVATVDTLFSAFQSGAGLPQPASLIDGAAAIKDLQDTILGYFFPMSKHETQVVTHTQELDLEFLNLTAPTSAQDRTGEVGWLIIPHRNLVDLRQDARQPFLYQYQFAFAALRPLPIEAPDVFVERESSPRTSFQRALDQITKTVRTLTNGVNTITDAFDQMVTQNFTGPIGTLLASSAQLGDAIGGFLTSGAEKLRFPLYAQRTLDHVLDAPRHSVTTLALAAHDLGQFLYEASGARAISGLVAGESVVAGVSDLLTLGLNHETPFTLALGTLTGGDPIAAAIQSQVRARSPQHTANASAYRDFTAVFRNGQYELRSGTATSNAARVTVVNADPALTSTDASSVLGLGAAYGGQEHLGSEYALPALALLRGLEDACATLQANPEVFAEQLAVPETLPSFETDPLRARLRGPQRLHQTRITPGDTLQSIGNRVGTPWEVLALVNRLTYPYILEEPTTLFSGRVSSAAPWSLDDSTQAWTPDLYQGQRVDIVAGAGAGQSRQILRNTATQLVVATAWSPVPTDTSDYAIRAATNPILRTGTVTSATARTLEDRGVSLVPESQRGLRLTLASGPSAGDWRRIIASTAQTYTLDRAWTVVPQPGTIYLVSLPALTGERQQRLIGDVLYVPQPSTVTRGRTLRSRVQDVSAITGVILSDEERLFGRDWLLQEQTPGEGDGALQWDATRQDFVTVAGLANLRQAMLHLINLPLGELIYAPGIGSYVQEELGLAATLPLQTQLLQSVERTIRQDPRIARMHGAELLTQGGHVLIRFAAQAIDGSQLDRVIIR